MEPLGKSPIPLPLLILGKLAMVLCGLFFILKSLSVEMLYNSPAAETMGLLLAAAGFIILFSGLVYLGKSVSVGLPKEKTELKTTGIYRITRNPIYVGAFLMCIGSCFYSIHMINIILCAVCISIHHWIITREEKFLEERFGEQWLEYKKRVPRYGLF